jgi:hypothetical protein
MENDGFTTETIREHGIKITSIDYMHLLFPFITKQHMKRFLFIRNLDRSHWYKPKKLKNSFDRKRFIEQCKSKL